MQTKKGLNQQCAHNPLIDIQKEDLSDEPPKATSLQQCEHMLRYLKSFHSSVLAWLVSTIWMSFADIFFSDIEATATLNLKDWFISSGIWLCEILLDMSFIARVWRYVYRRFKNCEKAEESISFKLLWYLAFSNWSVVNYLFAFHISALIWVVTKIMFGHLTRKPLGDCPGSLSTRRGSRTHRAHVGQITLLFFLLSWAACFPLGGLVRQRD